MGLRLERPAPGATMPLSEDLALTATREEEAAMMDPITAPRRSVLLLGYAGWGEGKLETEPGGNVWLTAAADPELIIDPDYLAKWTRALAGLGMTRHNCLGRAGRLRARRRHSTRFGHGRFW